MRHDDQCEMSRDEKRPACRCAERTYLATATPDEVLAWRRRRGYDTNSQSSWDLPPRRTA